MTLRLSPIGKLWSARQNKQTFWYKNHGICKARKIHISTFSPLCFWSNLSQKLTQIGEFRRIVERQEFVFLDFVLCPMKQPKNRIAKTLLRKNASTKYTLFTCMYICTYVCTYVWRLLNPLSEWTNKCVRLHMRWPEIRVARWFVFKTKIPIWVNFGGSCNGKSWYVLWPFGVFYCFWIYFRAPGYILWSFGIFSLFWFFLYQEKSGNPARDPFFKKLALRGNVRP
jgi:hypothetical protein